MPVSARTRKNWSLNWTHGEGEIVVFSNNCPIGSRPFSSIKTPLTYRSCKGNQFMISPLFVPGKVMAEQANVLYDIGDFTPTIVDPPVPQIHDIALQPIDIKNPDGTSRFSVFFRKVWASHCPYLLNLLRLCPVEGDVKVHVGPIKCTLPMVRVLPGQEEGHEYNEYNGELVARYTFINQVQGLKFLDGVEKHFATHRSGCYVCAREGVPQVVSWQEINQLLEIIPKYVDLFEIYQLQVYLRDHFKGVVEADPTHQSDTLQEQLNELFMRIYTVAVSAGVDKYVAVVTELGKPALSDEGRNLRSCKLGLQGKVLSLGEEKVITQLYPLYQVIKQSFCSLFLQLKEDQEVDRMQEMLIQYHNTWKVTATGALSEEQIVLVQQMYNEAKENVTEEIENRRHRIARDSAITGIHITPKNLEVPRQVELVKSSTPKTQSPAQQAADMSRTPSDAMGGLERVELSAIEPLDVSNVSTITTTTCTTSTVCTTSSITTAVTTVPSVDRTTAGSQQEGASLNLEVNGLKDKAEPQKVVVTKPLGAKPKLVASAEQQEEQKFQGIVNTAGIGPALILSKCVNK